MTITNTNALCSDVLVALSDEDCRNMFQMISAAPRMPLKMSDFGTRKRYYNRLRELKDAELIKRVGNNKCQDTTFGKVICRLLQTTQLACSLAWRMKALDEMNGEIPKKEMEDVVRSLIPDKEIQRIILETED